MLSKRTLLACLVFAAAAAAWLTRPPPPLTDEEAAPAAAREVTALVTPPATPPGREDVVEALERVFAGCVEGLGTEPAFVVADLNGDGSEDLVVEVRTVDPRLREANHELANWIVQDVRPRSASSRGSKRLEKGESLLAVIHGYGPRGWRGPEARQAYLLKYTAGVELKRARSPGRRGDVLAASLDGERGFLYWTGARYTLGR